MSKKLFIKQERTRINLQFPKELKKELEPYLELHGTNLTQLIHSNLVTWLFEQKTKFDQFNK